MPNDFGYAAGGPYKSIRLTTQAMPDALKRAITLMLFSDDPEIRNFNGQSVVLAFPTIPTGGFDGILFYLTQAATRIREILQDTNPEVTDVYFESTSEDSDLAVTLNVETNSDNIQTAVVYA